MEQKARSQKRFQDYEKETDAVVLARREKQIDYGKCTPEYHNYLQSVPKDKRDKFHPRTPEMTRKYSRRAWDGLIRQWRLNLHCWSEYPVSAHEQLKKEQDDEIENEMD